jgi:hypothetical protein
MYLGVPLRVGLSLQVLLRFATCGLSATIPHAIPVTVYYLYSIIRHPLASHPFLKCPTSVQTAVYSSLFHSLAYFLFVAKS